MDFKKIIKRERILWHRHFIPSLLAGVLVAFIAFVYEMTISNIIIIASVGASAVILTNIRSHHLTKLHTTIVAYVIAILVSSLVYFVNLFFPLHIAISIFVLVFLVGILLFLFNTFHPPAITASLSFIVLERPLIDMLYLFFAVIILFILVRFATYTLSQHLTVKEFLKEFKKSF
jgi:CBS-domain-containing membrane protein